MNSLSTIPDLLAARRDWPTPLALVPTMGALHEGHLTLIDQARSQIGPSGSILVSIFVNPLQFDRQSDLSSYPRNLENDLTQCQNRGANFVFHPDTTDFYHPNHSISVNENSLAKTLCGATRPGHFDGVCTVISRLFNLVQPDYAIFGKKDYQQLQIIKRLNRDLAFNVSILASDTLREPDGLALSSRNLKLTPNHRADAPRLRRALLAARDLKTTGEQNPLAYLETARHHLLQNAHPDFQIDYLELVSQSTLQPLATINQPALLAVAAFYGPVRLIDNIEIQFPLS
ncbi:MAG: pantoate--beta-alanine ligase [Verrucomicrobiota bacterium]